MSKASDNCGSIGDRKQQQSGAAEGFRGCALMSKRGGRKCTKINAPPNTGDHSSQDPSFTLKPIYFPVFSPSIFGPDYCDPTYLIVARENIVIRTRILVCENLMDNIVFGVFREFRFLQSVVTGKPLSGHRRLTQPYSQQYFGLLVGDTETLGARHQEPHYLIPRGYLIKKWHGCHIIVFILLMHCCCNTDSRMQSLVVCLFVICYGVICNLEPHSRFGDNWGLDSILCSCIMGYEKG